MPGSYQVFNQFWLRTSKACSTLVSQSHTTEPRKKRRQWIGRLQIWLQRRQLIFARQGLSVQCSSCQRREEKGGRSCSPWINMSMCISSWRISEASKTSYIKVTSWPNWTSKKPIIWFQLLIKAGCSYSLVGRTSFSNLHAFTLNSAAPRLSSRAALPSSSLCERTGSLLPQLYVDPRRDQRGAKPQFSVLPVSDDHREQIFFPFCLRTSWKTGHYRLRSNPA